jgi:hypothetical protein
VATGPDPTDLNRQERDAEAEEHQARETRRKELEDLRWLLGHPQGRRFAMRLLDMTGVFRSSFHSSGSVMSLNEGQRNIGLWFTDECCEASIDGYFKVLKEFRTPK